MNGCPIHYAVVNPNCQHCRRWLIVRRRQLQLQRLDQYLLSLSPTRTVLLVVGLGSVVGLILVGILKVLESL